MWGCCFIALGIEPVVGAAFALLAVAGAARSVLEVSGRTLLQRTSPPEVLARVFGLVEAVEMGALALGSLAVPALVALGGVDTALIVTGALLPALLALRIRALLEVDAAATVRVVEVALLRSLPIFAALPPGSLDGLARNSTLVHLAAGTTVIRQGVMGDRYYAIADGEVRVEIDGRFVRTMARGQGFGEIALLRSVRRTATVIAVTAVVLLEIDKDAFVVELTGHPPSTAAAESIIRDFDA
ncbi:MAG: cyclic nucleotide-binding domain-containing protein [Acidimicrobiia bacterium]